MSERLRIIEQRQRRDVRLLFTILSDSLANIVDHQVRGQDGRRPITEADRRAIMRDVDRSLAVIWGTRPNDSVAALSVVILRDTALARLQPLETAVKNWKKAMGRDLFERAIEDAKAG